MGSLAKTQQIREITIEGNPVALNLDSTSFLVAYLPHLQILSSSQVTEQLRRTAIAWRTAKERSNASFLDLSSQVCANARREEVISNAKTSWELSRSQSKCFSASGRLSAIKNDRIRHLQLQNSRKFEAVKLKSLDKAKSKGFGSLGAINVTTETRKLHFKRKSSSSENILTIDDSDRNCALEFKLPPILGPIINNITCSNDASNDGTLFDKRELSDSSEDESSGSLRSVFGQTLVKGRKLNQFVEVFEASAKTSLGLFKIDSSSSKTSSLDSSKSVLSDSSGSSLMSSDRFRREGRVKSAQVKRVAHYRVNRAATARAKHRISSVPSPPPAPDPPKEREQGFGIYFK